MAWLLWQLVPPRQAPSVSLPALGVQEKGQGSVNLENVWGLLLSPPLTLPHSPSPALKGPLLTPGPPS